MPRSSKRKLMNRVNIKTATAARLKFGATRRKVKGFLPAMHSEDMLERLLHHYPKLHSKARKTSRVGSRCAGPAAAMCDVAVQSTPPLQPLPPPCTTCNAAVQAVSDEEKAKEKLVHNLGRVLFDSFANNTDERKILVAKLSDGIHQSTASSSWAYLQK